METLGVDNERISFPLTHPVPVVQGVLSSSPGKARLFPPIQEIDPPTLIASAPEYPNALFRLFLQKLNSERTLKDPRADLRLAIEEHGIVLQEIALPVLVEIPGPGLKRRDLIDVVQVLKQTMLVRPNTNDAILDECRCGREFPIAAHLAGRGTQPRVPVRPPRRWRRGYRVCGWHGGCDCEHSPAGTINDEGVAPDLPASVSRHRPNNSDGISRAYRFGTPAIAPEIHSTLQFYRPARSIAPVLDFHEDMHMGVEPINF